MSVEWFAGLTVDHLYADCPNRLAAESSLRAWGWWGLGNVGIDPHGTDVCGRCVARFDRGGALQPEGETQATG